MGVRNMQNLALGPCIKGTEVSTVILCGHNHT